MYPHQAVHTAMCAVYLTSQKEGMTLEAYLDEFNNQKDVVGQCGGDIGIHPGLMENALRNMNIDPDDPNNYSTDDLKEAHRNAKEAYLAFVFLSNANKAKFALLLRELANSNLRGSDNYPHTVTEAHKLLVGWEEKEYNDSSNEEGKVLVTAGSGGKKVLRNKQGNVLECFTCGGNHYANQCDQKKENEEKKTKKDGHLHLTTSDMTNSCFEDTSIEGALENGD
eukprot:12403302-Ditylum_brightwellii.AAC.1